MSVRSYCHISCCSDARYISLPTNALMLTLSVIHTCSGTLFPNYFAYSFVYTRQPPYSTPADAPEALACPPRCSNSPVFPCSSPVYPRKQTGPNRNIQTGTGTDPQAHTARAKHRRRSRAAPGATQTQELQF